MKISGIYKIESKIKPERIYIGSAVNIHKRWILHLSRLRRQKHGNIKLQNHFNKYGEADLQFSILLGCEKEDLIKIEQYFIDSYKPHFNIAYFAGSPNLGRKMSDEHKNKISNSLKGKVASNKGISPSLETRLKISNSLKGRIKSDEECKNISKGQKGKIFSNEHRMNISKGLKGITTGRKNTEETKKKMSESAKRRINKPRIYTKEQRLILIENGRKGGFAKKMNQIKNLN